MAITTNGKPAKQERMSKVDEARLWAAAMCEWLQTIDNHLHSIEQQFVNDSNEHYVARVNRGAAPGGGGNVDVRFDVPLGVNWNIERITLSGSATTIAAIYQTDAADPQNLLEVCSIGASGLFATTPPHPIRVPANATVIIRFLAQGANQIVTARIQAQQVELTDAYTTQAIADN